MIELTVKTLDSRNHSFSVDDESTVSQLKEKISEQMGLAPEVQRLIYRGHVLSDSSKLAELDINGKVVHLVEREPPRAGQRPGTPTPGDNARPNGPTLTPRFPRLHGPFTPQEIENVLLETYGIPGTTNEPDSAPRVGPTIIRMALARRMIDHINSNMTALDQMAASLPAVVPPTPAGDEPMATEAPGDTNAPGEANEANETPAEPMEGLVEPDEEDLTAEEWLEQGAAADVPQPAESAPPAPANAATEGSGNRRRRSALHSPSRLYENNMQVGVREVTRDMVSVLRDLSGLQTQLSGAIDSLADTLSESYEQGSQRMSIRQRMVRRISDTMHNLSHLYHALSDVEVTLTPQLPRLLSRPAPRRLQIPIQTQINVMPNRRPTQQRVAATQHGGGAGGATTGAGPTATTPGGASITVTSSGTTPGTVTSPQVTTDGQPGRTQPTVHVDIRPEPLSYQVEIETRVPIAFAINSINAASAGVSTAPFDMATAAGLTAAAARLNSVGLNPHVQAAAAAGLNAAAAAAGLTALNPGLRTSLAGGQNTVGLSTSGQTAANPTAQGVSDGRTGGAGRGSVAPVGGAATAGGGAATSGGGAATSGGGAATAGGGAPVGGAAAPAQPTQQRPQGHLIAGTFPFGGATASDFLQNVMQSGGAGVIRRGGGGGGVGAGGGTQRVGAGRGRGPGISFNRPIFDRFLPCQYAELYRRTGRRATETTADADSVMRNTRYIRDHHQPPSIPELLTALRGYTISDFIDMEQHLPGESWFIDVLLLISREMTAAELVAAWSGTAGSLARLRMPLYQFVRRTVLGNTVPRDSSHLMSLYTRAADTFVDQHMDAVQWISAVISLQPEVDVEQSLRALMRARLPQVLMTVANEGLSGEAYPGHLQALLARLFGDVCALLQACCYNRENTLHLLFWGYVEERLAHLEPQLQHTLVASLLPVLSRLVARCTMVRNSVQQFVVRRGPPPPALPPRPQPAARPVAPRSEPPPLPPRPPEAYGSYVPPPEPEDFIVPNSPIGPGTYLIRDRVMVDGVLRPPEVVPISGPLQHLTNVRPPPIPPELASLPAPNHFDPEWAEAVQRDLARQQAAPAQAPFSDAYLSGAPPRKRKLMQKGKPTDISHMMQECIREATQSCPPQSSAVPDGASGSEAVARAADAGVSRAYWEHIRSLARRRIGSTADWSRERYPASYHYYSASNKRPFPDDTTD